MAECHERPRITMRLSSLNHLSVDCSHICLCALRSSPSPQPPRQAQKAKMALTSAATRPTHERQWLRHSTTLRCPKSPNGSQPSPETSRAVTRAGSSEHSARAGGNRVRREAPRVDTSGSSQAWRAHRGTRAKPRTCGETCGWAAESSGLGVLVSDPKMHFSSYCSMSPHIIRRYQ